MNDQTVLSQFCHDQTPIHAARLIVVEFVDKILVRTIKWVIHLNIVVNLPNFSRSGWQFPENLNRIICEAFFSRFFIRPLHTTIRHVIFERNDLFLGASHVVGIHQKIILLERMKRMIIRSSEKMILDNLENRFKWKMQFYFHQKIKRNLSIYFKWIHMNLPWHR